MKIRFQADNDVNQTIIKAVLQLEPTIDFQTAAAAKILGLPDGQVLAYAASANRLLISHDRKTMPHHFGRFITHTDSPGLLIVPQKLSVAAVAEELLLVWLASEPSEWLNRIRSMPL